MGATAAELRTRNVRLQTFRVGDIVDNPENWREHEDDQRRTFSAAVEQIGWFGYPDVYVAEDGRPTLVDGELRKHHMVERYGEDAQVTCNVTDFSPTEARVALLTKDPIAAMAGSQVAQLERLLADVPRTDNEDLEAMYANLAEQYKILTRGGATTQEGMEVDGSGLAMSDMAVRQVFLDAEQFEKYSQWIERLRGIYGAANAAETILEALRRQARYGEGGTT